MDNIIKNISHQINNIEDKTIEIFSKDLETIIDIVVQKFSEQENLPVLTNNYSLEFVKSLVSNHLYFIKNELDFKDSQTIFEHFVWEFSTYHKMGIPFNFFQYLIQ